MNFGGKCGHMVMMGHVSNAMRSLRHSFFEALLPLVIIRTSPSSFIIIWQGGLRGQFILINRCPAGRVFSRKCPLGLTLSA